MSDSSAARHRPFHPQSSSPHKVKKVQIDKTRAFGRRTTRFILSCWRHQDHFIAARFGAGKSIGASSKSTPRKRTSSTVSCRLRLIKVRDQAHTSEFLAKTLSDLAADDPFFFADTGRPSYGWREYQWRQGRRLFRLVRLVIHGQLSPNAFRLSWHIQAA